MGKYDQAEQDAFGTKPPQRSAHEFFSEQLHRKFLSLPRAQRDLITSAQEDGIEWRGEDTYHRLPGLDGLTHFEHVIRELMRQREIGLVVYKLEAPAKLRRVRISKNLSGAQGIGS
jgi:hypothetical protein